MSDEKKIIVFFILEYENRRAKIDIDSFVRKLGDKKTSEK